MFTSPPLRRTLAVVVTTTLGMLGSLITANSASATAPVEVAATNYGYTHFSSDGHSLSVPAHSSAWVLSDTTIGSDWAGWPIGKGVKFSRSAFTVGSLPTGLAFSGGSTPTRNWSVDDENDPGTCSDGADTQTFTTTAATKCATWLWVGDQLGVANDTDGALTFETNANTQTMTTKVGKKAAVDITSQDGVAPSLSESISMTSSPTIDTNHDSTLGMDFMVCLDETKFTAGDHLVVAPAVTNDGTPLTSGTDVNFYDNQDIDGDNDVTTYVAPDVTPFENLTIEFFASVGNLSSGTYTGSVTVTKAGADVTEPCPSNSPAYPTLTRHRGGQDDRWMFTQESFSMPTQIVDAPGSDDWNQYSRIADGFGGVFYWAYESTNPDDMSGNVKVVHETASGPDNALRADTGYIPAHANTWGMVTVGRYGAAGGNWYTLDRQDTQWVLATGSMSSTSTTSTTYTVANASKLCPKGYTASELFPNSAPTSNPFGELYCSLKRSVSTVLVSLTPTGLTALSGFPATSTTAPCLDFTQMVDARATGSDAAVQYYATTSAKGSDKACGGVKGAVETRQIIAIAANGTVTKKKLTKSPWGRNPEPENLTFGTRITHGDWLGLASSYNANTDQTDYGMIFTINVTSGITRERSIDFSEANNFGMWSSMQLVDEYGDGRMRVTMQGTVEVDGEWIARYGVGHIDFRTDPEHPDYYGYVDFNDYGEANGFGYYSGKMGALFSNSADGNAHLFMRTSDSQYTVGSWGPAI